MQEPSHGGAIYLTTFLNDYSMLSVVKAIVLNTDVSTVVNNVMQAVKIKTGQKLNLPRTDRTSKNLNSVL